jgi:hypothetical protein
MPLVHCGVAARTSVLADLAVGTMLDRTGARLTALGLRGFLAGFMASFMALALVRSAIRAMALNERWNERLKTATYRCLADQAGQ